MSKPRVRCSQLDRLLNCPGSRTLNAIIPPPASDYGYEGTAIHWEIAWRVVKELGGRQPEGGIPVPNLPAGFKLPGFSAWMIDWAFDVVSEIPNTWALEVENEMEWEFDEFILTGHEDITATSTDLEGHDIDWKTGTVPVPPADVNWQVSGYAALRRMIYGLKKLTFEIAQPRNDPDEGFARRSVVVMDEAALISNAEMLERRINEALADPMLLSSGLTQCKYCVGLRCPAVRALLTEMKYRLTPETLQQIRTEMAAGELVDLVAEAKTLVKPIDDAIEGLKSRLETEGRLVGDSGLQAVLKEENAGYKVVDPVGMFTFLEDKIGVERTAKALSYPSTKIKDALAEGLGIPKGGKKAPITAETVFAGAAAQFLEPKTKRTLILT